MRPCRWAEEVERATEDALERLKRCNRLYEVSWACFRMHRHGFAMVLMDLSEAGDTRKKGAFTSARLADKKAEGPGTYSP